MKKLSKIILSLAVLPFISGITSCQNNNVSEGESISEIIKEYDVNIPTGNGFIVIGEYKVLEGNSYSFEVKIQDGYEGSELVVKVNDEVINKINGVYTVYNVNKDLNISVSGIYVKPSITLPQSSFAINIDNVTNEQKTKAYYLNGVTGSYHGESCSVDVDISGVDFTKAGMYMIFYSLVGHEEVTLGGSIVLYESYEINDVTVDLSNTHVSVISFENGGESGVDFILYEADGVTKVSSENFKTDSVAKFNYFNANYLKDFELNTPIKFVADYEFEKVEFNVTITDKELPSYQFSKESGDYAFFKGGKVSLPKAIPNEDSAQHVDVKYLVNGVETNYDEINLVDEGDYSYEINIYRNNTKLDQYTHTYNIHIREQYDKFFAFSSGSENFSFGLTNKGNYTMIINYGGESTQKQHDSRDTLVSIEQSVFASELNNGCDWVVVELKLLANNCGDDCDPTLIAYDYDSTRSIHQLTAAQLQVGKSLSIGFNAPKKGTTADYYSSMIFRDMIMEFEILSVNCIEHASLGAWSLNSGSFVLAESSEGYYKLNVTNMTTKWAHLAFANALDMIEKGYTSVTIKVSGNQHNMYAYTNTEIRIDPYGYGSKIVKDGETTVQLQSGNQYIGIMSSQEYYTKPDEQGMVQDRDGTYGGLIENFVIEFCFNK